MGNVITVNLNYGCCRTEQYITDQKLYQYDYGQILKLTGIELPAVYEVHFSNGERGTSTTGIGTADGVEIPDQYLLNAGKLYVWLYTHTTEDDGETELGFWIPIIPRAQPTHEEPTPVQQTEIEQIIAQLENYDHTAETAAVSASSSANTAQSAATSAINSASSAEASASIAQQSATSAASSASSASTSETNAAQSAEEAEHYADVAEQVANTAGYMFMEIDSNGHLVYTRTDQVDADFHIERSVGHLILEAV